MKIKPLVCHLDLICCLCLFLPVSIYSLQFPREVEACAGFLADSLQPERLIAVLHLAEAHSRPALRDPEAHQCGSL